MSEPRIARNAAIAKETGETLLALELRIRFERIDEKITRMDAERERLTRVFFGEGNGNGQPGFPERMRHVEARLNNTRKSWQFLLNAAVGALVAGLVSLFLATMTGDDSDVQQLKTQVEQLKQQLYERQAPPQPWRDPRPTP